MLKKLPLAVAIMSAAAANAVEFDAGPVAGQFNTSLSYGVGWRTEDPELGHVQPGNADGASGSTYNYDDGTLNYEKGDVYTNVAKVNLDLELSYEDMGAFVRGRAFYDSAVMDNDPAFKEFNDATKDAAGAGYDLLDAFVWYNFEAGNMPISARLGRQVISWGESTFIQGGINAINPVDVSAARKPGVEIKEVLLPVNLAYGSVGLTDTVTLEAFYQLQWEKTRPDACGTFFSTVDFVSDGCGPVVLGGTDNEKIILDDYYNGATVPIAERTSDKNASNEGQFGLALRWYAEALGDTEFGFYYMNLHSRAPYISGVLADSSANDLFPEYYIEYPEDIKLTGISFNRGTDSGWSIGGEVSVKQDMPLQWNSFEILLAGLKNDMSLLYQREYAKALAANNGDETAAEAALDGFEAPGYDRYDVWQAQMTFIKFFDQVLNASRLSLVSEFGVTHVADLPSLDEARYGRHGSTGIGTAVDSDTGDDLCLTGGTAANLNPDYCTNDGYTDETSGGVRVRASLDYNNAIAGVNLKPKIALGYDIGNAPSPGGAFVDERITTSFGVDFDYLNRYSGGVAYTMYDGNEYDPLTDRDNVSLNLKVTF